MFSPLFIGNRVVWEKTSTNAIRPKPPKTYILSWEVLIDYVNVPWVE